MNSQTVRFGIIIMMKRDTIDSESKRSRETFDRARAREMSRIRVEVVKSDVYTNVRESGRRGGHGASERCGGEQRVEVTTRFV